MALNKLLWLSYYISEHQTNQTLYSFVLTLRYYNTILLWYVLLIVQQLMKIILTNPPTDITTFRASIAPKILSCITTIYYSDTLLFKLIWWLFALVVTDRQTYLPTQLSIELLSQLKIIPNPCVGSSTNNS